MNQVVTVPTKSLRRALGNAARITPAKSSNPIMSCVQLEFKHGQITMSCSSGSTDWLEHIPAECSFDAEPLFFSAALLSQVVANLPGDLTILEIDGAGLKIKSGGSKASVSAVSPDGAMSLFGQSLEFNWTADAASLLSAIQQTKYAAALSGDGRSPIFKGVQFELGERATCVATDGFRLARTTFECSGPESKKASVSDSSGCLSALELMLKNSNGPVRIGRGLSTLGFEVNTIRVAVGTLEGELPDWLKLIPVTFSSTVEVNRVGLLESIKRVGLFANQNPFNRMRVRFESEGVQISALSQMGGQSESIQAALRGEPVEMDFNCAFFIQTLEAVSTDQILLKPAIKKPMILETPSWFGLLMPIMD